MSLASINLSELYYDGYSIRDSEFGRVEVRENFYALAVIKAYSERNLPVGRNLALATLYWRKKFRINQEYPIQLLTDNQEQLCSHVLGWRQYKKERDEYLEKLLPLL